MCTYEELGVLARIGSRSLHWVSVSLESCGIYTGNEWSLPGDLSAGRNNRISPALGQLRELRTNSYRSLRENVPDFLSAFEMWFSTVLVLIPSRLAISGLV